MSTTPKRTFTAKTTRPVIDASALYGMEDVPSALPHDSEKVAVASATAPVSLRQEWVQFSTYLHRETYLRLKQAEYWEPGFVVRQQIEQVVSRLLDELEGANRSLPEEQLQELLAKNKKLRPQ